MQKLNLEFDAYDLDGFTTLTRTFGQDEYAYVVTPNTDHIIRYYDDPSFRELYRSASFVLLDSRFLSKIFRHTHSIEAPVCAGSDLTAAVFNEIVRPDDRLVLIGASREQAELLRKKHGLHNLQHHNPPMGFISNPNAVEACLQFVEQHSPFRFCFLAIGSPQQEVVANMLKMRGLARGMTFCIGASIDFLTGAERRAPQWMQRLGCEWLFRLFQSPRRLASRYLVRGPRIFSLMRKIDISLRMSTPDSHASESH